ncbi:TonB-dependent receptor [Piscinibacter sp. XHJ-5]|uniref:TonB-dependent receptor plug domain-containing protein n=1 Tax=Piscinibacter sp. XHJ-5 TaxID=3037797 RepID=UPI0024531DEB|nr:TonB-dependent receptor [Piscinibacter sp. XHJ-5]
MSIPPRCLRAAFTSILLAFAGAGHAQDTALSRLRDMSLEELSDLVITSVSKRAEPLSQAPASVFVITADDIRRAGATTLPEALRLAPGLQVSRDSATGYVISARGFNAPNSNKLLVLIDGRSVYTPLFSGVFWDVQDVMLEDVERIEVISGPGGTLWGANAVNGVINVITQRAAQTQGALVSLGAGERESQAAARYGAALGAQGHLRVYARHLARKHTRMPDGSARDDAAEQTQLGLRADAQRGRDRFTALGNVYDGSIGQPAPGTFFTGTPLALADVSVSGAHLLARWERSLDDGANVSAQAYYDHTRRVIPPTLGEELDIVDLQFQHGLRPIGRHALVWGAQYRASRDRVSNSTVIAFLPASLQQHWSSLFAQDEIRLGDTLHLTLGARLERNDYTGSEFLPNARLAWQAGRDQLVWTALSRTVRAPSRLDRDIFAPGEPPFVLGGGPDFRSERAHVFELGWRGQPTPNSSLSATVFRADYDRLRTLELAPPGSAGVVAYENRMSGRTHGIEMWGSWQATRELRLSAGYTQLHKRLQLESFSLDLDGARLAEGSDPRHRWMLRASFNPSGNTEVDGVLRHVSSMSNPAVESYSALDLRFAWRVRPGLELSLTAQNLLDRHVEYQLIAPYSSEFGRSLFLKAVAQF